MRLLAWPNQYPTIAPAMPVTGATASESIDPLILKMSAYRGYRTRAITTSISEMPRNQDSMYRRRCSPSTVAGVSGAPLSGAGVAGVPVSGGPVAGAGVTRAGVARAALVGWPVAAIILAPRIHDLCFHHRVIPEACKGPSVVPSLILHKAGLVAWPVPTHYRSVAFSRSRARAGLCGTRSPVKRGAIRLAARLGDLWPNSPARHRPCKPQAAPAVAGCRQAQDHLAIAPITGFIDPSDPSPPGNRRAHAAPMRDKCSTMPTPIQ
jgi:hypothetical protein